MTQDLLEAVRPRRCPHPQSPDRLMHVAGMLDALLEMPRCHDPDIGVIVVTALARFCAGGDVKEWPRTRKATAPASRQGQALGPAWKSRASSLDAQTHHRHGAGRAAGAGLSAPWPETCESPPKLKVRHRLRARGIRVFRRELFPHPARGHRESARALPHADLVGRPRRGARHGQSGSPDVSSNRDMALAARLARGLGAYRT